MSTEQKRQVDLSDYRRASIDLADLLSEDRTDTSDPTWTSAVATVLEELQTMPLKLRSLKPQADVHAANDGKSVPIDELKRHVDVLKGLLDDPQPGLFTWHEMFGKAIGALQLERLEGLEAPRLMPWKSHWGTRYIVTVDRAAEPHGLRLGLLNVNTASGKVLDAYTGEQVGRVIEAPRGEAEASS